MYVCQGLSTGIFGPPPGYRDTEGRKGRREKGGREVGKGAEGVKRGGHGDEGDKREENKKRQELRKKKGVNIKETTKSIFINSLTATRLETSTHTHTKHTQ